MNPAQPNERTGAHAGRRAVPLPQLFLELRELVVTYVKEQTLVPLKALGRYLGYGVLGSVLLGGGVVLLAMAGLRALQTETGDTFTGDWSWAPYLMVIAALTLGATMVWLVGTSRRAERRRS